MLDVVIRFAEMAWPWLPELLAGARRTAQFALLALVLGLSIALPTALARNVRFAPLRWIAWSYVELIRNTPLLVQLLFVFFALPTLGLRLSGDQAAMLALVINFGAYATEILRAGIEAVPKPQIEAAQSLGLGRWEVLRHVVLMPALERVYPALTSQFILLMLGSAAVSAIGAEELTSAANDIQSITFASFEVYLAATFIYIGLTTILRGAFGALALIIFPRRRRLGSAAARAH